MRFICCRCRVRNSSYTGTFCEVNRMVGFFRRPLKKTVHRSSHPSLTFLPSVRREKKNHVARENRANRNLSIHARLCVSPGLPPYILLQMFIGSLWIYSSARSCVTLPYGRFASIKGKSQIRHRRSFPGSTLHKECKLQQKAYLLPHFMAITLHEIMADLFSLLSVSTANADLIWSSGCCPHCRPWGNRRINGLAIIDDRLFSWAFRETAREIRSLLNLSGASARSFEASDRQINHPLTIFLLDDYQAFWSLTRSHLFWQVHQM